MTAIDTAARVLDWAMVGEGPPPLGDWEQLEDLVSPPTPVRNRLKCLAARGAAGLRLVSPPLEDDRPASCQSIILALAIALAPLEGGLASRLLAMLDDAEAAWEQIARHALVAPALAYARGSFADALRGLSPLTEVLLRPAPGNTASALARLVALARIPAGRRLIVRTLATPTNEVEILSWRAEVLERLRVDDGCRSLVLEVYEVVMEQHWEAALEQIVRAEAVLVDADRASDAELDGARAYVHFWRPLSELERIHPQAIRLRPVFDTHRSIKGRNLVALAGPDLGLEER